MNKDLSPAYRLPFLMRHFVYIYIYTPETVDDDGYVKALFKNNNNCLLTVTGNRTDPI